MTFNKKLNTDYLHTLNNVNYYKNIMTVNPHLATLMRIIEENMDKINEGEYLDAMNALGSLYQDVSNQNIIHNGLPSSYTNTTISNSINMNEAISILGTDRYRAWYRVIKYITEYENLQPENWIHLSNEEQNRLNRLSTKIMAESNQEIISNTNPEICPFIARHSIGHWSYGSDNSTWKCVCGYIGKSKHWKNHEVSERHREWAEHRIVPKRIIREFHKQINQYEHGILIYYNYPLAGGVRYFPIRQEKNEWTHPELFTDIKQNMNTNINNNWLIYPRSTTKVIID